MHTADIGCLPGQLCVDTLVVAVLAIVLRLCADTLAAAAVAAAVVAVASVVDKLLATLGLAPPFAQDK